MDAKTNQVLHQSNGQLADSRLIEVVDIYLSHLAKPVVEKDCCASCSHLIVRQNAGSICREAKVFGDWPAARVDDKPICHCQKYSRKRVPKAH